MAHDYPDILSHLITEIFCSVTPDARHSRTANLHELKIFAHNDPGLLKSERDALEKQIDDTVAGLPENRRPSFTL